MSQLGLSDLTAPVKCPKCNILNFGGRTTCEGCGKSLFAQLNPSSSNLIMCADCSNVISRWAACCPKCGRPYNVPRQQPTVGRIAGGVILGYLGILVINFIVGFIMLMLFAGMIGSALSVPSSRPPSSSSR